MEAKNVISELAKNELLISKLYQRYSENLPEMRNFWLKLTGEEIRHQKMVLSFQEKVESGEVSFDEKRFKIKPIELVQGYLMDKIEEAEIKKPGINESLAMAATIENSLLEKKIFTIFEADSYDLNLLLSQLQEETKEHLKMVQEKLESLQI